MPLRIFLIIFLSGFFLDVRANPWEFFYQGKPYATKDFPENFFILARGTTHAFDKTFFKILFFFAAWSVPSVAWHGLCILKWALTISIKYWFWPVLRFFATQHASFFFGYDGIGMGSTTILRAFVRYASESPVLIRVPRHVPRIYGRNV